MRTYLRAAGRILLVAAVVAGCRGDADDGSRRGGVARGGAAVADWPEVGADKGGARYSPLAEIDRTNVARLREAWRYHTGDVSPKSAFQATPVVAGDTLYFCTPTNRVVALDAESFDALGFQ